MLFSFFLFVFETVTQLSKPALLVKYSNPDISRTDQSAIQNIINYKLKTHTAQLQHDIWNI